MLLESIWQNKHLLALLASPRALLKKRPAIIAWQNTQSPLVASRLVHLPAAQWKGKTQGPGPLLLPLPRHSIQSKIAADSSHGTRVGNASIERGVLQIFDAFLLLEAAGYVYVSQLSLYCELIQCIVSTSNSQEHVMLTQTAYPEDPSRTRTCSQLILHAICTS